MSAAQYKIKLYAYCYNNSLLSYSWVEQTNPDGDSRLCRIDGITFSAMSPLENFSVMADVNAVEVFDHDNYWGNIPDESNGLINSSDPKWRDWYHRPLKVAICDENDVVKKSVVVLLDDIRVREGRTTATLQVIGLARAAMEARADGETIGGNTIYGSWTGDSTPTLFASYVDDPITGTVSRGWFTRRKMASVISKGIYALNHNVFGSPVITATGPTGDADRLLCSMRSFITRDISDTIYAIIPADTFHLFILAGNKIYQHHIYNDTNELIYTDADGTAKLYKAFYNSVNGNLYILRHNTDTTYSLLEYDASEEVLLYARALKNFAGVDAGQIMFLQDAGTYGAIYFNTLIAGTPNKYKYNLYDCYDLENQWNELVSKFWPYNAYDDGTYWPSKYCTFDAINTDYIYLCHDTTVGVEHREVGIFQYKISTDAWQLVYNVDLGDPDAPGKIFCLHDPDDTTITNIVSFTLTKIGHCTVDRGATKTAWDDEIAISSETTGHIRYVHAYTDRVYYWFMGVNRMASVRLDDYLLTVREENRITASATTGNPCFDDGNYNPDWVADYYGNTTVYWDLTGCIYGITSSSLINGGNDKTLFQVGTTSANFLPLLKWDGMTIADIFNECAKAMCATWYYDEDGILNFAPIPTTGLSSVKDFVEGEVMTLETGASGRQEIKNRYNFRPYSFVKAPPEMGELEYDISTTSDFVVDGITILRSCDESATWRIVIGAASAYSLQKLNHSVGDWEWEEKTTGEIGLALDYDYLHISADAFRGTAGNGDMVYFNVRAAEWDFQEHTILDRVIVQDAGSISAYQRQDADIEGKYIPWVYSAFIMQGWLDITKDPHPRLSAKLPYNGNEGVVSIGNIITITSAKLGLTSANKLKIIGLSWSGDSCRIAVNAELLQMN